MFTGKLTAFCILALAAVAMLGLNPAAAQPAKLKALVVDGQNNHNWKATTPVIVEQLKQSGRFEVTVATSPARNEDMSTFKPKFSDYDVIVSNYNGKHWSDETKKAFVDYVKGGGGLVIIHAADNSFGDWAEYNEMIGVGGWGGRNEKSGPMLYWEGGKIVRDESPGRGGTHGPRHEFVLENRAPEHPIMKGVPTKWLHAKDELYAKMRGPAKNLTVLATAYDNSKTKKHEPQLMVIDYGKGRVFHTTLGHDAFAMNCVGFYITTARGTEWAATGKVTIPVPGDFPNADNVSTVSKKVSFVPHDDVECICQH